MKVKSKRGANGLVGSGGGESKLCKFLQREI